jgi:hypothetical protein
MRSVRRGRGTFAFQRATFEDLPTLHHILNRLAAIELSETVDAGHARTAGWQDVRDIRVVSA